MLKENAKEAIKIIKIYLKKIIEEFNKTQNIDAFKTDTVIHSRLGLNAKFNCREIRESIIMADFAFQKEGSPNYWGIDFELTITYDGEGKVSLSLPHELNFGTIEKIFIETMGTD